MEGTNWVSPELTMSGALLLWWLLFTLGLSLSHTVQLLQSVTRALRSRAGS